jgi:hypothetical protein
VLIGPRQVGKTTLINSILKDKEYLFLDGDDNTVTETLANANTEILKSIIGNHKYVFVDEVQRIPNIGLKLKIMVDQLKDVQVIVSGSSSLDINNVTQEPLTGRKFEFHMFPVSWNEFENSVGYMKAQQQLEIRLLYGMYPDVIKQEWEGKPLYDELSDAEQMLADSLLKLAQEAGPLDKAEGIWVGYVDGANNENNSIGVNCGNCALHKSSVACLILDMPIEEEGACRFAVIPDGYVTAGSDVSEDMSDYSDNMEDDLDMSKASLADRYSSILSLAQPDDLATLLNPNFQTKAPEIANLSQFAKGNLSFFDRMIRSDLGAYLPGDLLVKVDIATMANSLELRSPMLDVNVVEWGLSLPRKYKIKGFKTKHILKDVARSLVPANLIDRPKMGFGIPRAEWLRTGMKELVMDTLTDTTSTQRGWLNPAEVKKVLDLHMSGQDKDSIIWPMLMLELWARTWLD